MKTVLEPARAARKRTKPATKRTAPHKPGEKVSRLVDEDTRVLIAAIKGLKGLR